MSEKLRFKGGRFMQFIRKASFPTVKGWNRLEGRPRTHNFDQTLKAEVRDALWMLTRQWQMGEFQADDAGSPVTARVQIATTRIDRYQARSQPSRPYDESVPLETRVEREAPSPTLDISLLIASRFLRLLSRAAGEGEVSRDYRPDFISAYPIQLPDRDPGSADVYAHQEVWQMQSALSGRSMDGAALYARASAGEDILQDITLDDPADEDRLREIEQGLLDWAGSLFSLPSPQDSAWAPSHLEYQFACSAPAYPGEDGQRVLVADEYHQGHLDWYSFDISDSGDPLFAGGEEPTAEGPPPETLTFDFIPAEIEFSGMPNTRWWQFEDRKTSFGDINAQTTDLARLMLIEFGLIYANDWFLLPFDLPVGSLARVGGLAVTNVFGERIWIGAAGRGADDDWQRWAMYNLSRRGRDGPADHGIFLPPAVDRLEESPPLEEVLLVRDEMANMVWGIEKRVPLANGLPREGREAASERIAYLTSLIPPPEEEEEDAVSNQAKIRYRLMTDVPENWIPFIPVHMPEGDNREIQLQRAAMLRALPDSEERPRIRPRTELLRHNLEGAYFIHEEEVPRAGAKVNRTYQRGRWHDGKVCLWLGRRKTTGRGESSSGLAFDRIRRKRRRSFRRS